MALVFFDETFAKGLREQFRLGQKEEAAYDLKREADRAMSLGPWSVTYHKSPAKSSNPHDYFSEGPYWWPNPEDPSGPYIRRDGEKNPDLFEFHRNDLKQMTQTALLLAAAGYCLDEPTYTKRAYELLAVWFVEEETRMNPHLEYGQAIRGHCDGRGIGIIDTAILLRVVHAADYLMLSGYSMDALRQWFAEYLNWMNTSKLGLEEKHYFNNHGNWWNTQAAAYAAFCGEEALLEETFESLRTNILPKQMNPDGSFADELTRTNSYTYSLYNLEATILTCEIAHYRGVDLWHFTAPEGQSAEAGISFMLPYLENPFLWQHQQIHAEFTGGHIALQLGGLRLGRPDFWRINRMRREGFRPTFDTSHIGPLCLLPGYDEP